MSKNSRCAASSLLSCHTLHFVHAASPGWFHRPLCSVVPSSRCLSCDDTSQVIPFEVGTTVEASSDVTRFVIGTEEVRGCSLDDLLRYILHNLHSTNTSTCISQHKYVCVPPLPTLMPSACLVSTKLSDSDRSKGFSSTAIAIKIATEAGCTSRPRGMPDRRQLLFSPP